MKKSLFFFAALLSLRLAFLFSPQLLHHFYIPSYHFVPSYQADILIFSYDRPMQLHALLESQKTWVKGSGSIHVLYLTSSSAYEKGYQLVKDTFSEVHFHREEKNKKHFKKQVLDIVESSPSPFILFAVDDDIVTGSIDIEDAAKALETQNAYAFLFRLGKNIALPEKLPYHSLVGKDKIAWVLQNGKRHWRYGHNLDYTLYNKAHILADLQALSFQAPNSFEEQWNLLLYTSIAKRAFPLSVKAHRKVLSYTESKITNIPLNLVNKEIINAHMEEYPKEELLEKYLGGEKIDVKEFAGILPLHTHIFVYPRFISH
jgi:hypothetical protein